MSMRDRSARYHLTPDKSQRLFNLLAKRKGAKDRQLHDVSKTVGELGTKRASQNLAPNYDLAQFLTNAGADPQEVRNLQYLDPATAQRLSPVAREWAQRGDLDSLGGMASAQELQREQMQEYLDRGWGDQYKGWFGQEGYSPLERFGINALRGGGQALDRQAIEGSYEDARGRLMQSLIDQGLDHNRAAQLTRMQMPSLEQYGRQIADQVYEQGQGGGALNFVSPFLTGAALPLSAGWNAYRALNSDAARGMWGDQEAQGRTDALLEASQRAADARGGPNAFRDLGAVAGLPLRYGLGFLGLDDPQTATVDAARGGTSLLLGGQDYTERKRQETLKNLQRAQSQWDAQYNTLTRGGDRGGLTREGLQAKQMQNTGLAPREADLHMAQGVGAEKTSPYRNIWGTFDGLPAYLGLADDKSEFDYAKEDVMGQGLNPFSTSGANPLVAHARNVRDWFTGRDTMYERLRDLHKEDEDPRLQMWNKLHDRAEQGKFDLGTLQDVHFGTRGDPTNKPWYNFWSDPNTYGERTGVQVDKLLDSDFWKTTMDKMRRGELADVQANQLMQWSQQQAQQNPELGRILSQQLKPAHSQWQANRGRGQTAWMDDAADWARQNPAYQQAFEQEAQRRRAQGLPVGQQVQPQVQPQAQVQPQPQQAQPNIAQHQNANAPQTKADEVKIAWAKCAGPEFASPSDIATRGPSPSDWAHGFTPRPTTPPGPHLPGGRSEALRAVNEGNPFGMGQTPGDWSRARRQAAFDQFQTAPDTRRQYYAGMDERWSRPYDWRSTFRPIMSQQDQWLLDPVIQRHREALLSGNWAPGMLIDKTVNRGTFGITNPIGPLARWIGLASPEGEAKAMLKSVRGSQEWKRLLKQYQQGLISRDQLQNVAPADLSRLMSPEEVLRSSEQARHAQTMSILRQAQQRVNLDRLAQREANPLGAS